MSNPVRQLCEEFFEWRLREWPEFATFCGFHQYDDRLNVNTEAAFAKRGEDAERFLERARRLATPELEEDDRLNLQLLTNNLMLFDKGLGYKGYLFAINHMEGLYIDFDQLMSWMVFNTVEDFKVYVKRLKAIPQRLGDDIELLKEGVRTGITNSIFAMEGVVASIRSLDKPVEDTTFYRPFIQNAKDVDTEQLKPVAEEAKDVIKKLVKPAFHQFADYVEKEYLPACRQEEGVRGIPGGAEFYQQCLNYHTSLNLTAQEIHDIGLREVDRIRAEMEEVIKKTGFEGSFEEFLKYLRTTEKFYYNTKEALLAGFHDVCEKQIRPSLAKLFPKIPESQMTLELVPACRGGGPMAYYLAGTLDGSRKGTFYINANNLKFCPKYEMMGLSLHEGEPGHHFQGMYAIEARGVPAFRQYLEDMYYSQAPSRFDMNTAYVEGWGLYCEYLGRELGLYEDPYVMFGHLSFEMHRACRLVVDTGLHALGWSFEKAHQLCVKNTAECEEDLANEIRRYIAWPGQACAYKIGQMKIQELRQKAGRELGEKFDVREFHDQVLGCLPVSLPVLESVINRYIQENLSTK